MDVVIEKAAAARYRNRLLISPSKPSVVGVVEEMVKQKLVTLSVPSLILDEIRRLGWIYPSRLIVTYQDRRLEGVRSLAAHDTGTASRRI